MSAHLGAAADSQRHEPAGRSARARSGAQREPLRVGRQAQETERSAVAPDAGHSPELALFGAEAVVRLADGTIGVGSVVKCPGGSIGRVVAPAAPRGRHGRVWLVKLSKSFLEVGESLLEARS